MLNQGGFVSTFYLRNVPFRYACVLGQLLKKHFLVLAGFLGIPDNLPFVHLEACCATVQKRENVPVGKLVYHARKLLSRRNYPGVFVEKFGN